MINVVIVFIIITFIIIFYYYYYNHHYFYYYLNALIIFIIAYYNNISMLGGAYNLLLYLTYPPYNINYISNFFYIYNIKNNKLLNLNTNTNFLKFNI